MVAGLLGCTNGVEPKPGVVALHPSESRDLPEVRLTFVEVRNDSRCPIEAMCVWIGNAEVVVSVQAPFTRMLALPVVLNTAVEPRFVDFGSVRIELDSLTPPARLNPPLAQSDYTALFTVKRTPQ